MKTCGSVRKWYGGREQADGKRACVCDLEVRHKGKHMASDCTLKWMGKVYENKQIAARFHAIERIQGRHTTLQVLRERAQLTQAELAQKIGCAQPDVSEWEAGRSLIPDEHRTRLTRLLLRLYEHDIPLRPVDLDRSWDDVLLDMQSRSYT